MTVVHVFKYAYACVCVCTRMHIHSHALSKAHAHIHTHTRVKFGRKIGSIAKQEIQKRLVSLPYKTATVTETIEV